MLHSIRVFIISITLTALVVSDVIHQESFETESGYTFSDPGYSDGSGDYFLRSQNGDVDGTPTGMHTYTGLDGEWFIVGEDVDSEGVAEFTVTLDEIDATGYSDVTVSILVGSGGQFKFDTGDYLILEYDNNNSGAYTVLGAFYGYDFANGDGTNGNLYEDTDLDGSADDGTPLGTDMATFTYDVSDAGQLDIRVRVKMNSGDEEVAFDNIVVSGSSGSADGGDDGGSVDLCEDVTCPAASGDCYVAGSCDSTTGTCSDETMADDGTACDDGDDATTGDSCTAGVCSGTVPTPGVFISENCDPKNNYNPDRYAEIYNPTDNDVDLTGWTLENVQGNSVSFVWDLSGTIAPGQALVCGNADATDQTITPDFTATWSGNGWNGKGGDGSILKDASGNVVDYAVQADATGKFDNKAMTRNYDVAIPTATYDATEWTFSSIDDAVDSTPGSHLCYLPPAAPDVYIVGDMNGWTHASDGWGIVALDGVGSLTATLEAGTYSYKAVEGTDWNANNYPTADNGAGGNQSFTLTETGDVTFYVNIDNDLVFHTNPSIVGDFFDDAGNGNDWAPDNTGGEMMPVDGSMYLWKWSGIFPSGNWQYKVALNQNWDQSTGGNISISGDGTSTTNIYYDFATNTTSSTVNVTFNVDMNYETVSQYGVSVRGSWDDFAWPGTTMDDSDADGVHSLTLEFSAGDVTYKYHNGGYESDPIGCGVTNDYGGVDRVVTVANSELNLDAVCYSACSACAPGCIDPLAENTTEGANVDDGSCTYAIQPPDNLVVYFNEFHYDNIGNDSNEGFEVVATAGMSTEQLGMIVATVYNGSGGVVLSEHTLDTFTEGVTVDGLTYYSKFTGYNSFQNSTEGFSVSGFDQVFEFLSYEGTLTAQEGAAASLTSTDVGVSESNSTTPAGTSIQKYDTGWVSGVAESWGDVNTVFCNDEAACNYLGAGDCTFAETGLDCDGNCNDDTACNYGDAGACTFAQEDYDCAGNALVLVTFSVDMSNETVATDACGPVLNLDGHKTLTDGGNGVWSVTLELIGGTTYTYKFKNGCNGWEDSFNDLGCGAGNQYGDRTLTTSVDDDMTLETVCFNSCSACPTCSDGLQNGDETGVDCGGSCAACETCDDGTQNQDETGVDCGGATCSACCANDGNVNGDDKVNIADIVQMVDWILNDATQVTENLCSGDIDLDGTITVADLVAVVNIILDVKAYNVDQLIPSYADIILTKDSISLRSDGNVSGVQMTLSHGSNFNFNIEDEFVSEYQTSNSKTTIVMISETGSLANIGTYNGSCNVDSFMAVDANAQIIDDADLVLDFDPVELKLAGPNPFNPTTSLNVVVAEAGHVSVNVYNVVGQKVATLLNDYLNINTSGYTVNWDASNLSSGVYLVRAETANSISTQKLMLLK